MTTATPETCQHPVARLVLVDDAPRPVAFCPDCGVQLTAPPTCTLCGAAIEAPPYCQVCGLFWERVQLVAEMCYSAGLSEDRAPELWQALGQVSYYWQIARNRRGSRPAMATRGDYDHNP